MAEWIIWMLQRSREIFSNENLHHNKFYLVYMRAGMTKKFRYFSLALICVVLQFNQTFAKQEILSKEANQISSCPQIMPVKLMALRLLPEQ